MAAEFIDIILEEIKRSPKDPTIRAIANLAFQEDLHLSLQSLHRCDEELLSIQEAVDKYLPPDEDFPILCW